MPQEYGTRSQGYGLGALAELVPEGLELGLPEGWLIVRPAPQPTMGVREQVRARVRSHAACFCVHGRA